MPTLRLRSLGPALVLVLVLGGETPALAETAFFTNAANVALADEVDQLAGGGPGVDSDLDGLDDLAEQANGTDPNDPDTDRDGLADGREVEVGTNPLAPDSDHDTLLDGFEVTHGFDPLTPGEQGQDPDADGFSNWSEQGAGTNPKDDDTDGDGMLDGDERGTGTFGPQQVISTAVAGVTDAFAADLDRDLDLDVVTGEAWFENTDGAGSFGAAQALPQAQPSASVTAFDYDGDGDVDILSSASNGLVRFDNTDGDGTFSSPIAMGNASIEIEIGDFDADGDVDFVTPYAGGSFGSFSYWTNQGGGSFSSSSNVYYPITTDSTLEDVDGDGDLDAVIAHYSSTYDIDNLLWVQNDGTPNFGTDTFLSFDAGEVRAVAAADLDGDLDVDVAVAASANARVGWFENTNGSGSFGTEQLVESLGASPSAILAVDLDGDLDADLVVALPGTDTIGWYANDGTGSFGAQQTLTTLADGVASIRAVDVDGDGDRDVLSASPGDDKVAWYEQLDVADPTDPDMDDDGLSDGFEIGAGYDSLDPDMDDDGLLDGFELVHGFDPLQDTGEDELDPDADGLTNLQEQAAGSDPHSTDSDGDGLLDGDEVAGTTDPATPDTDGDGLFDTFELANGLDPAVPGEQHLDPDSDGLTNVAEQGAGTDILDPDSDDDGLLDGEEVGSGVFGTQQVISTLASGARSVYAADLDGDRDVDVLSASWIDGKVAWYENTDGAGTFAAEEVLTTLPLGAFSVTAADLDGDRHLDVLAGSIADDAVSWHHNTNGSPQFGARRVIGSESDAPYSVHAADVDGDGAVDVLVASNLDDSIAWLRNDGNGDFGPKRRISAAADGAHSVFSADLDGDGDPDVLSASFLDDKIAWYENTDGAGTFGGEHVISLAADAARSVHAADLDGDGDFDVISASSDDDTVAWYENTDGLGTFGAAQVLSDQADGAYAVYASDVDGDGDFDVLAASFADDSLSFFENTDGAGTFAARVVISTSADSPRSVFAADINGDGAQDVLSASLADNEIAWYPQLRIADPLDADSDDDGLLDGFEVTNGFDPLTPGEQGLDPDLDGLDNLGEQAAGTSPLDSDSDDDGWDDGVEIAAGTDPTDPLDFPNPPMLPALHFWSAAALAALLLGFGAFRTRRR